MGYPIKNLTIEGFKSIKFLTDFPLRQLNILIDGNGSGKSNMVSFFRLIRNMMNRNLQYYIQKNGGPEAHLFMGSRITERIIGKISFDNFDPDDVVVIDREDEYSVFKRLESAQMREWLQDYTLGELWCAKESLSSLTE